MESTPRPDGQGITVPLSTPPHHHDSPHHAGHDWTADLPQTDHVRFFRTADWARSRLGPLSGWSVKLRLFAGFVLADARAACLWWASGEHLVAIYNAAYAPLAAQVHPSLMGSTFKESYPDLWPAISQYFDQARSTGVGVSYSSAAPLLVERKGWREEAFFSGSFTPVGPPHHPDGFYNSTFEVTSQKLADRRTSMLNQLAAVPAQTVDAVFDHILTTLDTNASDVPLALLYKLGDGADATTLQLRGHTGLPPRHQLLVDGAYIDSEEGLVPEMRRAGSEPIFIDCDKRFDSASWKGWGEPSAKIAVLPIVTSLRTYGFLILGTNPYRPHDAICEQFIRDLHRMASSIVSAAVEYQSTRRRQEQLEADLAFSDLKLRHLIDHASVGMCHVSLDGQMLWANDHYYHLSGRTAAEHATGYSFFDVYLDEDRHKAVEVWESLMAGLDHATVELRLKRMYETPTGESEPMQIQVLAFPYRETETGMVKSIMACTTDISKLQWAQNFQARLAAEAREAKRQQEAFIDVVSHEMRNPLSAIVHCADAIASAVEDTKVLEFPEACFEALKDNVQSAEIILQCANHQKRIIDDILTLSKLDSMLLSITPVAVKPHKLVASIVNIFEAEMKSNNISYKVYSASSLADLDIDYVYLDPSRLTQIFINLLTNAIKFVKASQEPNISICFGASLSEPRLFFPGNMFWATRNSNPEIEVTQSPEWGSGQELYLTFSVQDSGIGLQSKDIHKIFERFRQATIKTHVRYGGSGLGLFISKELTEKQGGEIGVSSVLGEGSTFGFYVKARRVERRPQTIDELFKDHGEGGSSSQSLHVLLVEDNIINQQVLSKQLKKAGCEVDVANHGLEALDILKEKAFDIVLMDLEMPVLDGLATMREIRQRERTGRGLLRSSTDPKIGAGARLPLIAVTANVRQEQIDTAISAGADRVMQKPFKAADLVHMMQSLMHPDVEAKSDTRGPGMASHSNGVLPESHDSNAPECHSVHHF